MRIVEYLSHNRKLFQKRRVESTHIQKFKFHMKNFGLGIHWSNGQCNSFDFERDRHDLLIIFIEFLLAKRTNFKNSTAEILLKFQTITNEEKVIVCGAKSFLTKNRRNPQMEMTLEFRGSATLIKKIRENWETPLELLNHSEEDFKTFIRIKTSESRHRAALMITITIYDIFYYKNKRILFGEKFLVFILRRE